MKEEYKKSMEQISLSESDKARILANVKKACEEPEVSEKIVPLSRTSRFSARRIVGVAAAFAVLLIGALLIRSQIINKNGGDPANPGGIQVADIYGDQEWEELESVDDIPEQTDCKIYTLGKGARDYKVAKVEVVKKQKHVRLTYKNRKEKDEIIFEYKEEAAPQSDLQTGEEEALQQIETLDDTDLTDKFKEKSELATEKIGKTDVTMYGEKKCEGMTWQEDDTSFAVTMSKACSKKKARELVKDTTEKTLEDIKVPSEDMSKEEADKALVIHNAIGWDGTEEATSDEERKTILQRFYEEWGFKIRIHEPASEITYKQIDDCESYSFYYPTNPKWKDCLFIGYVGWHSCPSGVKRGFETYTTEYMSDNTLVKFKKNKYNQKMFTFHRGDLYFVFLLTNWRGDLTSDMVQDIYDVVEVVEEEENSVKEDESQTTSKDADDNQNKNSSAQDDLPEPTVEPDEEEEPKENVETGTPNPIPTETPELLTPSEE